MDYNKYNLFRQKVPFLYIADLHIHSRFSRATSRDCDLPHLDFAARRKGIRVLGTGDFTHPAWRAELKEQLVPAGEGVYMLREDLRLPDSAPGDAPYFIVTGEISSIYKRDGKTRKVHNLILLPGIEAADALSAKLEAIGNIHSDGRPILGLDSRDLLELTMDTCPDAEFIPAHIWTPHFSMFGAFSGFETIESCFADMTPYIHAVETGLSSDPPMNWRVSALDRLTLVSHSDAHSPSKLGREANLLDTDLSYTGLITALQTGNGFLGTIEFFPEEGKYHLDGHRNCGVCLMPAETAQLNGRCPVCGKKLTIGVEHRVEELADRPAGFRPENAKPFESLAPLPEVIAASSGGSSTGKKTMRLYEEMLRTLGTEFDILRRVPLEEIEKTAGICVRTGIERLRLGQVKRRPGFDGEYGTISLLTPAEIEAFSGQISLFGATAAPTQPIAKHKQKKAISHSQEQSETMPATQELNDAQQSAVQADQQTVAVIAGPGTGKTKTLVSRIVYLVKQRGVKPEEITAVTFTNQAADEMRQRLQSALGGKRAVSRMTIGTFHAICLRLLGNVHLISASQALRVAEQTLQNEKSKMPPKKLVQAVSLVKNGMSCKDAGIDAGLYDAYCSALQQLNVLDFDDLLLCALKLDVKGRKCFSHLLVDEFQDINETQYQLIRAWSAGAKSLFVIGDPDQSIYGFRGANSRCFEKLKTDVADLKEIRLSENYRSAPEILTSALCAINKNPGEKRSLSPHRDGGIPVRWIWAADDFDEGIFIAKEIGRMTGGVDMLEAQKWGAETENRAFSDIAVLCRTHRQLELIEKCLRHDDIPCVVSGREDFLDEKDVRGALAFFKHLLMPGDVIALADALQLLWNCPADLIESMQTACKGKTEWDDNAFGAAAKGRGYLEAWLERANEWRPLLEKQKPWQLIERWETAYGASPALEQLKNTAVFYADLPALFNALLLGEEADLRRASGKDWKSGAVQLMTFHGAKGLEFPAVFVAGVKTDILPLKGQDIEEERRLFYVGMTRAKAELILTCGADPSAFLEDVKGTVKYETAPIRQPAKQLSLF